jgi:three-Cys-motif partner protein
MSSSKKNDVISVARPHSIKKFELISEYVKAWIQILMQNQKCKGIVYIDCMSNSGIYKNDKGEEIEGTPLLVAKIIADAMQTYSAKQAYVYFNDIDSRKIDLLNTRLPRQTNNFHIHTEAMDANELLRKIGDQFRTIFRDLHFLLIYDPYDAHIEWDAMMPFLRNWGEVIINHMVSDPTRAVKVAKKREVIEKYEETYQSNIEELISFGSDKDAFEKKLEQIIRDLSGREDGRYYIASFPFFSQSNTVVYNLIHCTGHYKGFELFKSTAWKTFGDKSSLKNTHNNENQLCFNFDDVGEIVYETHEDASCYNLRDAALYVQKHFKGKRDVPNEEVWDYLGQHPVFPTRDYKNKIKDELKREFGMKASRSSMTFSDRSY